MKRITADLKRIGKLTAVLLEPVDDSVPKPTMFLTRALALTNNLPFGCERIQLVDRALMHLDTHNMYEVWVVTSTPQSRTMSVPPAYKMLRLMVLGADVDKVTFTEPQARNNQYALQAHTNLINGLLASIGLRSQEVHLLPETDRKNRTFFFAKINPDQVNAVVSHFGSKPRFQIQPISWYQGLDSTCMAAVYEVWIKKGPQRNMVAYAVYINSCNVLDGTRNLRPKVPDQDTSDWPW